MLTLITGVPGAGKTLYCVDKILRDILKTKVTRIKEDGTTEEIERQIFTNINGLALEHVFIDGSEEEGIKGWQKWCKPGDFIVFDEIQKEWPPRPNGSKVPDYIQALETHRHMGVDFVLLTQNPGLIDQNVRALVGRHLHVRRLSGSSMTIVYEWDHCSRQLLYSNALTKFPYKYSADVFKLYKSSELHTKQKHTKPFLLWVALAAVLAALWFIPASYRAIANKSEAQKNEDAEKKNQTLSNQQHTENQPSGVSAPPALSDLVLVGHMVAGAIQYLAFEWHAAGQYRAVLTSDQLTRYGYTVTIERDCVVTLEIQGQTKKLGCLPPPLRYQNQQSSMLEVSQVQEEPKNGARR